MNSKRTFIVLVSIIGLLVIGLAGGAYGINKLLSTQSQKLSDLKASAAALSQEQTILVKDKKDIQSYSSLNQIAKQIVPQDKNQAEAVRELVNIAGQNNIELASITFPSSTLTAPNAPTANSNSNTPAPINPKTVKLSQLIPVKSLPGVYQLIISVQSSTDQAIPYKNFINFLSDLEHNRRTSQITNIAITPDPKSPGNLSFNLILTEYIKP